LALPLGAEEQESDEDVSLDDAREGLRDALDEIEGKGRFATYGTIPYVTDPYITLQDGSSIMLPLSAQDARRIIAASHEAPFGKGKATIVDETIRKTWELNAEDFSIRNPSFRSQLNNVLGSVSEGLGIEHADTEVQLYKLLLYEPGAHFTPHKDSEKVPGMFATLMISLPSIHEGGALQLNHHGILERFETSKFQPSYGYAAWYADVTHEVEQVTSGFRLVLIYNVVQTSSSLDGIETTRLASLRRALARWQSSCVQELAYDPAIYMLEHNYTDASISLNALKGADLAKAQALQQLADDLDFTIYLASMEKMISGSADDDDDDGYNGYGYGRKRMRTAYGSSYRSYHEIVENISSSLSLKRVVDINGAALATDVSIKEVRFCRPIHMTTGTLQMRTTLVTLVMQVQRRERICIEAIP
jgi:hypothetical protein